MQDGFLSHPNDAPSWYVGDGDIKSRIGQFGVFA